MLSTVADMAKTLRKFVVTLIMAITGSYAQGTRHAQRFWDEKGLSQRHWLVPRGSRPLEAQASGRVLRNSVSGHRPRLGPAVDGHRAGSTE